MCYTTSILKVVKTFIDEDLRCLTLIIHNQDLDFGIDTLQDIITELFNCITNVDEYNNYGNNKAIMLIGILENNSEYSLHHNVYLNNNSNYKDYYNQVKENMEYGYEDANLPNLWLGQLQK